MLRTFALRSSLSFGATGLGLSQVINPFTLTKLSTSGGLWKRLRALGLERGDSGYARIGDPEAFLTFARSAIANDSAAYSGLPIRVKRQLEVLQHGVETPEEFLSVCNKFLDRVESENMKRRVSREEISFTNEVSEDDLKNYQAPELSPDQEAVVKFVESGCNVYIGGPAGTGKTVVLQECIHRLRLKNRAVAITATTGVAAVHIGGHTFHNVFGNHGTKTTHLLKFDAVVIDEVSMLHAATLAKFDETARRERRCWKPFGGIQVILCGDFLQLDAIPPDPLYISQLFLDHFLKIKLTRIHRLTAGAEKFGEYLANLRRGHIVKDSSAAISFLSKTDKIDHDAHAAEGDATFLFPRNKDVEAYNRMNLDRLDGETVTFESMSLPGELVGTWTDTFEVDLRTKDHKRCFGLRLQLSRIIQQLFEASSSTSTSTDIGTSKRAAAASKKSPQLSNRLAMYDLDPVNPKNTIFGVRLQVLPDVASDEATAEYMQLQKNKAASILSEALRQSKLRTVAIVTDTETPFFISERLDALAQREVFYQPISLKVGARVMLRWNLSRVNVNGSTGIITGFEEATAEKVMRGLDPKFAAWVEPYCNYLQSRGFEFPMLPVVEFNHGGSLMIPPIGMPVGGDMPTEYFTSTLVALPLQLGYAFTVHKVQGLTLRGKVVIDLSAMWKCNHAVYVALSRVRTPEQLVVKGMHPDIVCVEAAAVEFDATLPAADSVRPEDVPAECKTFVPLKAKAKAKERKQLLRMIVQGQKNASQQDMPVDEVAKTN
eukprot:PhM_4_TR13949/c1_g1_i1/m.88099/K15255/PIF1; ATP-dependent DNA helicase PIF1